MICQVYYYHTKHIELRVQSYQTGNYKDVHLLTVVPGWGRKEEYALHALFARQRVRNEWFLPSAELLFLIRCLHFICHNKTDIDEEKEKTKRSLSVGDCVDKIIEGFRGQSPLHKNEQNGTLREVLRDETLDACEEKT